jgi:soluble lytic murein transglycosylase
MDMRAPGTIAILSLLLAAPCAPAQTSPASTRKHTAALATHSTHPSSAHSPSPSSKAHKSSSHTPAKPAHSTKSAHTSSSHTKAAAPVATAESRRLASAFVASAQLRPMAQQLIATRSPAAFAGVRAYADSHSGDGAFAASLALGHAAMLDHQYGAAESDFRQASQQGDVLADYADYLGAQAAVQGGRAGDAIPLLSNFASRHPRSLFVPSAPVLLATAYLGNNDSADALRVLQPLADTPGGAHSEFRAVLARAYGMSGNTAQAASLYRDIYLNEPLSSEAANAKTQLAALNTPLSAAERKQHADAMFNAKQFTEAATEYRAREKNDNTLSQADRDALEIYAAVCDLRLKKLSRSDVAHLPVTGDDSAALKLYLQSELARNENKSDEHDSVVAQLEQSYPHSRWLEEALDSGGNMYLVKGDDAHAIDSYEKLFSRFPQSTYAPSAHWHAAWLSYRLRRYPDAARLMDEQITSFPAGTEVPGALYWRGRLLEDVEHNFPQAANYYRVLSNGYINSYYAMIGRQRLDVLGSQPEVAAAPALAAVRPVDNPHLTADLPENDLHLIKARLLANAALNEYIRPELQLSDTAGEWSALAEAEIYESFGESSRALQAMKRAKIPFLSLPVSEVPMAYWQIVFPRPYWTNLTNDAQANGLDPYLVAALIRQESEFNPNAVSKANAYGLMQLLAGTGKTIAKHEGDKHFTTGELLDPAINLQLGTADLRSSISRWGGQVEYALASYNAGDTPVHRWIAENDYKDIPEWVESIPYTETREYVQAIIRNREMYRAIYSGK